MDKNLAVKAIFLAVVVTCLLPQELHAQTTQFGADALAKQADSIKQFLFGPAMRVAGVFGGAYGMIQSILSSDIRPLMMYGGVGLGINALPAFIDGVFVSGMLLPF